MLRITFSPFKLKTYFNNRVRESCKSCKRYGKKSTCPPHVESVEYYRSVLCSYNHGMLFERFSYEKLTEAIKQHNEKNKRGDVNRAYDLGKGELVQKKKKKN